MKILFVEDYSSLNDTYSDIIAHYNKVNGKKIEIISANSMEELLLRILTERIDGAIIDNNLDRWGGASKKSLADKGFEICNNISEYSNFSEFGSQVILYSAKALEFENTKFRTVEKVDGETALSDFETKILEPMSKSINIKEIDFEKFGNFSIPEKSWYYKKYVSNKINAEQRFKDFAPAVSWSSDLVNENNEVLMGNSMFKSEKELPHIAKTEYSELDEFISVNKKIPTLLWNFTHLENFELQESQIIPNKFKNNFISLFYSLAYSKGIASHILAKYDVINDLPSLVREDDDSISREIQCEIIEKLHQQNDIKHKCKKYLGDLQNILGLEILDYFKGTVENFEVESDIARVQLSSLTDPEKYFYKNISYKWLNKNGIKFRDSEFNYCISDSQKGINSYVEPR